MDDQEPSMLRCCCETVESVRFDVEVKRNKIGRGCSTVTFNRLLLLAAGPHRSLQPHTLPQWTQRRCRGSPNGKRYIPWQAGIPQQHWYTLCMKGHFMFILSNSGHSSRTPLQPTLGVLASSLSKGHSASGRSPCEPCSQGVCHHSDPVN